MVVVFYICYLVKVGRKLFTHTGQNIRQKHKGEDLLLKEYIGSCQYAFFHQMFPVMFYYKGHLYFNLVIFSVLSKTSNESKL